MFNKKFTLCGCLTIDNEIIYQLAAFRGHIFRIYPDGIITYCSTEDREAAQLFLNWLNK